MAEVERPEDKLTRRERREEAARRRRHVEGGGGEVWKEGVDSSTEVQRERAVLCGITPAGPDEEVELSELGQLAKTAGADVVDRIVQKRDRPDPSAYLGKGKIEELGMLVDVHDGNLVVTDDDLTPAQGRKLEAAVEARVIDRSQLILDIFARHARTKQARLQVELAQLEYTLPRLKRMWTHLERLGGGIGTRGPGETQIETDRRLIRKKISDTKKLLETIKARKEREVAARSGFFTVGIVGYTNAGKSTLHEALTQSGVEVADKLFATLDTKTSMLELPRGGKILLSDTVGFIKKLPHHLVECFHATLEEARHADLLLHVVDGSHPDAEAHMQTVREVLIELGMGDVPVLYVLNKIDREREPLRLTAIEPPGAEVVRVSAKTRQGFDDLFDAIQRRYEEGFVQATLFLPPTAGKHLAQIENVARVESRDYEDDGTVRLVTTLPRSLLGRLEQEVEGFRWQE